ncbi:MAG: hypothetical protein ACLRRT_05320 [Ruthenibacterium lactatiformans]
MHKSSEFGATVVNLNAAGIIASYDTKLAYQPAISTGDSLLQVVDACHAQEHPRDCAHGFFRIRREVRNIRIGLPALRMETSSITTAT